MAIAKALPLTFRAATVAVAFELAVTVAFDVAVAVAVEVAVAVAVAVKVLGSPCDDATSPVPKSEKEASAV